MSRKITRKAQKGFTLVELLVVVLILAILMAVALPLYLGAIQSSEKTTARANMQTIANANQAFKLRDPNHAYASFVTDLSADIGGSGNIQGPGDRTYTITLDDGTGGLTCTDGNSQTQKIPKGGFAVQSSHSDDGCFIPGVTPN